MKGKMETLEGKMATKDNIIDVQRDMSSKIINVQHDVSSKLIAIIAALIGFWATLLAAIITFPYLYGRADRDKVRELEARLREEERLIEEIRTEGFRRSGLI